MPESKWQNSSSALCLLLSALYRSFAVVGLAAFRPGSDRLWYVGQPAVRIRGLAVDRVEEPALNRFGNRPAAAVADRNLVHRTYGRQLDGRTDEKDLICDVKHFAGDVL